MATVCLSMIVKDEAHCIERCLASVKPHIAYWVISDTGSTDDTLAVIRRAMAGVPGVLTEDTWVDFATNRNLPLQRALHSGCDYVLSIDADEWLLVEDEDWLETLARDANVLIHHCGGYSFPTLRLVSTRLPWYWEGVLHEHLTAPPDPTFYVYTDVGLQTDNAGARSQDPEEGIKDLEVLQKALADEPNNTRYQFYVGCTLGQLARWQESIDAFRVRLKAGGDNRWEIWYSLYQVGIAKLRLGEAREGMDTLQVAYGQDPNRAETIYWLGMQYYGNFKFAHALPYFELASTKDKPVGIFVEPEIYDYRAQMMLALCCAFLRRPEDAKMIGAPVLERADLTADERQLLSDALTQMS